VKQHGGLQRADRARGLPLLLGVCAAGEMAAAARAQWETCLAKLRASSRPDAAAIEEIIRDLVGMPYPLDFCREADVVGNLLCDLCRLARLVRQFRSANSDL
jgi:hypothetical protein